MSQHPYSSILSRAEKHADRLAVVDEAGEHTYAELVSAARRVAGHLLENERDLEESRIAFMAPPGFEYVVTLWGIWSAGGIAVPLCVQHPAEEIAYVLEDADVGQAIASSEFVERLEPLAAAQKARFLALPQVLGPMEKPLPNVEAGRRAMILYTSGTTSRPKGVVTTHANTAAQIECLVNAWGWVPDDRILHVLPLHHVHGIINVLSCALWSGATCEMLPKFDAGRVIERISRGGLTLFMAVPTIYVKLIAAWRELPDDKQRRFADACSKMRLMVSGSAALPVSVLEQWKSITAHTLLERYGMTEIGMALSNPLHGERRPGFVGTPLPGVEVFLADEQGNAISDDGVQGEICVRGAMVFKEYWRKEEATRTAFRDGWFLSGDIAVVERGAYRIQGRSSVDIIKSGGYKISALEIEEVLLRHPDIRECAVVGVADEEWGERVSAAVVVEPEKSIQLAELREWAADKLAKYKMPSRLMLLEELPRNVMGKVTKQKVKTLFESDD